MKLLSLFSGIGAFEKALDKLQIPYELVNYCEKDKFNVIGNYSPSGHDATRVVHPEGIAPTVKENHGSVTATIVKVDIPQIVRVRTYTVDTRKLVNVLRHHKELCDLSNKEIAKELNLPITKVEHWFRTDKSFAIPDENIWFDLKELLKIDTDEFDKSITTFEEREGVYEKSNRCYHEDGISPTITSGSADEKIIVRNDNLWTETQAQMITENGNVKRYINSDIVDEFNEGEIADISFPNGYNKGKRVHNVCPAINVTTTQSSFITKVQSKNKLEIPLYKDTKLLRETIEQNDLYEGQPLNLDLYNRSVREHSQTLTDPKHNTQRLWDGLRIRKLTPKECWRLMGFEDADFEKTNGVISNTQLYKQAGNSIVVDVLVHILSNLLVEQTSNQEEKQTERVQEFTIFDFIKKLSNS